MLLLSMPLAALAGDISGTIRETGSGDPISSITVYVYNAQNSYVGSTSTAGDGTYSYTGLAAGNYYLRTYNNQGYIDEAYDDVACPSSSCGTLSTVATAVTVGASGVTGGIDFDLAPGGTITGRVTATATGLGIANARIRVYTVAGSSIGNAYTDSNGDYTFSIGLPTGNYVALVYQTSGFVDEIYNNKVCVNARCDRSTGTPISVTAGVPTTGIDFALDAGGFVSGRVTRSSDGTGVESVTLDFYDSSANYLLSTSTDSSGNYLTSVGLPTGSYRAVTYNSAGLVDELYNNISCPGGSCTIASGTSINVTQGSTTTGINFQLSSGGSFSGVVTDAGTGTGLADAYVRVYRENGSSIGQVQTDASGNYTFSSNLVTGTYFAIASQNDYVSELYDNMPCALNSCTATTGTPINIVVGTPLSGIDFSLAPGSALSGTVRDAVTSDPVGGGYVYIYNSTGNYVSSTYLGGDGTYRFPGLSAGNYYLTTSIDGYLRKIYGGASCSYGESCDATTGTPVAVGTATDKENVDISVDPAATIAGRVSNAGTGEGLASKYVYFYNASGTYLGYRQTDAMGNYSLSSFAAGTYFAWVRFVDGFIDELFEDIPCPSSCTVTNGTPIVVTAGQQASGIDFALSQGGTVTGRVTDATNGQPVANAIVELYDANGSYADDGTTDADGYYSIGGLGTGIYHARTDNARYSASSNTADYVDAIYDGEPCDPNSCQVRNGQRIAVVVDRTTSGIDFSLQPAGRISGSVEMASTGSPVTNGYVNVYNASGNYFGRGYLDSNGDYFVQAPLPVGPYFVRLFANGNAFVGQLYDGQNCLGNDCVVTSGTPVNVTSGVVGGIDFVVSTGGTIQGTVTAEAGGPLSGIYVDIHDATGKRVTTATTNSSGDFTTERLPPGDYYAWTYNGDGYIDEVFDDYPCAVCDVTQGTPISLTNGATATANFVLMPDGGLLHQVVAISGPSATPDSAARPGTLIALSVLGVDTMSHSVIYQWQASCPGLGSDGSFDDANTREPVWTAPFNSGTEATICTLTVIMGDSGEPDLGRASVDVVIDSHAAIVIIGILNIMLEDE